MAIMAVKITAISRPQGAWRSVTPKSRLPRQKPPAAVTADRSMGKKPLSRTTARRLAGLARMDRSRP